MSNCPCNGCDRRLVGCHGLCKDYQSWKEAYEAGKEKPHETPEFPRSVLRYLWKKMRRR